MFHLFHTYVTFKCFILFGELGGRRAVMVARHGHRAMGRGELGPTDGARGERGARAGQGKHPLIEANKAGCTCEASHRDARALRRGRVCVRDGKKNQ
jgi:hypothetical protein